MPEMLPCRDCQTPCRSWPQGHQGRCKSCKDNRRELGLNIFVYHCVCNKQVLVQARNLPSWDGLCPGCRFADKVSKGATVHTRYQNGRPYEVALFDHEVPKDRYDREVL